MKPAPYSVQPGSKVIELSLRKFVEAMSEALPPLIAYVNGSLRQHDKWGKLMPYHVPAFAETSPGHIVRPDIIMTGDNRRPQFVVGELDFVPSGRGFALDGLDNVNRRDFLQLFADWYQSIGDFPVRYATGTVTVCREETDFFAHLLREEFGTDIESVNIDEVSVPKEALVDRLFYRSELSQPFDATGIQVMTAEPWLDSKMIFAVVHDPDMTRDLKRELGGEDLAFLRSALAETHLVEDIMSRPATKFDLLRQIVDRQSWILKPTEVEEDTSWGSRGVMIGSRYSKKQWVSALEDFATARKPLGRHPVIQRMAPSRDFTEHWDAMVRGEARSATPEHLGKTGAPETHQLAERQVHARLGVYFMVSNITEEVFVPPSGILTLRQDPLAHGSTDARFGSFLIR